MTFDKEPFVWYFPTKGQDYRLPAIKVGDECWGDPAVATLHVFTRTGIELHTGVAPLERYETERGSGKWDPMEEDITVHCTRCERNES